MFKENTLSFRTAKTKLSSIKKKAAVFFIFMCMSINGFVPSTVEISRYSLVMIAAVTAQNMAVSLLQKCNAPLEVIASKVCTELREFLFGFSGQGIASEKSSGTVPEDTSDNHTATVSQATISEVRRLILDIDENLSNKYIYVTKNLFMLYQSIKIPDEGLSSVLILSFIMFIVGIRQRKSSGDDAVRRLNKSIERTRISA